MILKHSLGAALLVTLRQPVIAARYFVCVGTYTREQSKGIYAFRLDTSTAGVEPMGLVAETLHPSFVAAHPSEKFLYAVNEHEAGTPTSGLITACLYSGIGRHENCKLGSPEFITFITPFIFRSNVGRTSWSGAGPRPAFVTLAQTSSRSRIADQIPRVIQPKSPQRGNESRRPVIENQSRTASRLGR